MRLALYQPEAPQNFGAVLRIAACFDVPVEIIEPAAFPLDDRRIKRVSLDYGDRVKAVRHAHYEEFQDSMRHLGARLVLMTSKSRVPHHQFPFREEDAIILGQESSGVPDSVLHTVDARVRIPMVTGARTLNVHVAAAIALAEALRQTGGLDRWCHDD